MNGTSCQLTTSAALRSIGLAALLSCNAVFAGTITPAMQQKVDAYKTKATTMAADPALVKAVKEANSKGAIPGVDNPKWEPIPESDPIVAEMIKNTAGTLLTRWMQEDAKGLNKLVLTGKFGQRFAFTSKPASYMSKEKPHFSESFGGKLWQMKESQPDPSTKIETVQITVPVKDGNEIIGVLLLSLTAENLTK